MKKNFRCIIILGIFLSIFVSNKMIAQVTIGSANPSAKGALLELKSKEAGNPTSITDIANVTSDKGGLGLPRVKLVDRQTLEPFISTASADWTNAGTNKIKEKHAGLVVYNLQESPASETVASKILQKGVYIWDGAQWNIESFNQQNYFYLPSFNIPLSVIGVGKTFDLYAEYKKQFTAAGNTTFVSSNSKITTVPSPLNGRLYAKKELDYVIAYYDDNVLDNVEVDNDGVMTYDIKSINTTPDSFLNVVFVVK